MSRYLSALLLATAPASLLFGLATPASAAGLPVLPNATGTAAAFACFESPCDGGGSQAATSPFGAQQPLSTFGSSPTWLLVSQPRGGGVFDTFPNTPGVVSAPGGEGSFGKVTMNRTHPAVSASGSYLDLSGGGDEQGVLTYFFEVVNSASPTVRSAVDIGVTAKGNVSVTTDGTEAFGDLNSANVSAKLNINGGPGSNVLTELAWANYSYYSIDDCIDCVNNSTSNVTGTLGPISSFSGGFSINDLQVPILTDTEYQVVLTANAIGGVSGFTGTASVDPFIITPPGYQLDLSPGILNGIGGVPEPSAWAMLLVGFAVLGFAHYHRTRRNNGEVV